MATPVRLLFFAGSSRTGSFNKQLARLGSMIADANGIPVDLRRPRRLPDADL